MQNNELFRQRLSEISKQPVSSQDADSAFNTLGDFLNVLLEIHQEHRDITDAG